MSYTLTVLPASGIDKAYSYESEVFAPPGTLVTVPLGRQTCLGVVEACVAGPTDSGKSLKKPKEIHYALPRLQQDLLGFLDRLAAYTMAPRGLVLKLATSAPQALTRQKRPAKDKPWPQPNPDGTTVAFESDQQDAITRLTSRDDFSVTLLDGVTGSGKTEVYFELVAHSLRQGKQALILMPEIALSESLVARFEKRFGCAPALWHSDLTPAVRKRTWQGIATGQVKVVIGARSALFLPFPNLGAVVVDEEHDTSYKQEDGVRYHGRDMAVLRAQGAGCPILLVSATPSLESWHNAISGKYAHIALRSRIGTAALPDVHLIDMRVDKCETDTYISPTLRLAMQSTLERGEQVLLFLNRRGYAPLTLCTSCGERMQCPNCTAWLVQHKSGNRLFCHHCGYGGVLPKACPSCHSEDSLKPIGPGVERITEEATKAFPNARVLMLASDTVDDAPALLQDQLERIRDGAVDIIVGTQIIAKGHHFPNLTCVGVVDADAGLYGGDLRAAERTWQLLHQVSGRAGREQLPGHAYLQTYAPDSRLMQTLKQGARDDFLRFELAERSDAKMPPFSRLAALIISGKNHSTSEDVARELARTAPAADGVRILGPAAAPLFRLRGDYRWRLLVRAPKSFPMQSFLHDWLTHIKTPSSVVVHVDIDPITFL